MGAEEARALIQGYLPYIKQQGRIIIMTPPEGGYRSDSTHVTFSDDGDLCQMLTELGCVIEQSASFPFPRWVGKLFIYNEFVVVGIVNQDA